MTEGQENPVQQPVSPSPSRLDSIADKIALVVVIGLMICVVIIAFTWCMSHIANNQVQPQQVQIISPTPVPTVVPTQTPEPIATPTPALPATLTFTVREANSAPYGGTTPITQHFTVQTTTGSVLILPDFASWNILYPGVTYTCVVMGLLDGYSDVYYINNCKAYQFQDVPNTEHILYYTYKPNGYLANHYQYYYWNKRYWNDDGRTATPIDGVHLPLHATVISAQPPNYQYPY